MKEIKSIFVSLFLLLFTFTVKAQIQGADYFAGKWSVLLKGIPGGDTKMVLVLEKKDTTITGVVQDSTGTQIAKIDKADLTGASLTVYFTAQGYEVNLLMD